MNAPVKIICQSLSEAEELGKALQDARKIIHYEPTIEIDDSGAEIFVIYGILH